MNGEPDIEVLYKKTGNLDIIEHRTFRTRANEFVVFKESDYNSHSYNFTGGNCGHLLEKIREESRRIYKINGQYALFFDLELSETFRDMKRTENIDITDYILPETKLSLLPDFKTVNEDTDMHSKEHEIEQINLKFQTVLSDIIRRSGTSNQIENHPIGDCIQILAMPEVADIVHHESFLVQQNRDLYWELFHVACCLVPEKSEIASNVTLSWEQDLNAALFNDNFVSFSNCVDLMKLMDVTQQFINCIHIHDKLDKGRKLQKDLLIFSRKNKAKALKDRKDAITQAWITYPGFRYNRVPRENELAKIQAAFIAATKWQKVKYDWEEVRNRHIAGVRTELVNRHKKDIGDGNGDSNNSWADRVDNEGEISFVDIVDNKSSGQTMHASLASTGLSTSHINPYLI